MKKQKKAIALSKKQTLLSIVLALAVIGGGVAWQLAKNDTRSSISEQEITNLAKDIEFIDEDHDLIPLCTETVQQGCETESEDGDYNNDGKPDSQDDDLNDDNDQDHDGTPSDDDKDDDNDGLDDSSDEDDDNDGARDNRGRGSSNDDSQSGDDTSDDSDDDSDEDQDDSPDDNDSDDGDDS